MPDDNPRTGGGIGAEFRSWSTILSLKIDIMAVVFNVFSQILEFPAV